MPGKKRYGATFIFTLHFPKSEKHAEHARGDVAFLSKISDVNLIAFNVGGVSYMVPSYGAIVLAQRQDQMWHGKVSLKMHESKQ